MSAMFPSIRRLFLADRLDEAGLDKAVRLGWITEDEKAEIMAEKNPPVEETPVEPEPTPEGEPETEPEPDESTEGEEGNE